MTSRVKKRLTLLVAAVVLLTGGVAGAYAIKQAHTRTRMAVWLREGMEAYKAGDYQKTMELLGKYAGLDRNNEPEKSRASAEPAAARNPNDQQVGVMRAHAHLRTGDAAGTIQLAKDAAAMSVKSAAGFQKLLLLLDLLSRIDPSLATTADQVL